MGRIVGFDYGKARIGIAISDERKIIAQPLAFFKAKNTQIESAQALLLLLKPYFPLEKIVLGLPLLLNGKEGDMAKEVKEFAKALESVFSLPVQLWDERLTSAQAERALSDMQTKRKDRKKQTDSMAAAVILENFMASR